MTQKKIDPAKLAPLFEEMMVADDANRYCADCRAKGPRWASTNLGVFICIKCAGIHRSIGTHITKVKSISLDGWEERQVELMRRVGNSKAARIWECGVPEDYPRPSEHSDGIALEAWIRTKYERRLYFDEAAFREVFSGPTAATTPSPSPSPKPTVTPATVTSTVTTSTSLPTPAAASVNLFSFDGQRQQPTATVVAPAPVSASASLFAPVPVQATTPVTAPRATSTGSDLLDLGTQPASTASPSGATAAPKRDVDDIMRLYGTSGTAQTTASPTMMMPTTTTQPIQPMQQGGQGANYAVDLRAYGLYRNPGAAAATTTAAQQMPQQMTPQQMQQYLAYQQQLQQQQAMAARYKPMTYGRP